MTGHGVFVCTIFSRSSRLSLAMQEAEVVEDCFTQQGLTLAVHAVIAFKVGDDHESIASAARRFQGDQGQMPTLVGRIFSGHLRSIIGSMTVEAIIREQQTLADAIVDASKHERPASGWPSTRCRSAASTTAASATSPRSRRHTKPPSTARRRSRRRRPTRRRPRHSRSARNQAEYARQTAVARAQFQAEIDQAEQRAAQAGPLAAAQAMQDVLVEQARVAQRNADLRQAQLIAEVVKPAEAEAEALRTLAKARADAVKLSAEAAAVQGRIALDQKVIEQLPDMLRAAAEGLQGANLTVLDGAEGLSGVVASLAGQGMALLDAVRGGLGRAAAVGHASAGRQAPLGLRELTEGMVNREARRGADR